MKFNSKICCSTSREKLNGGGALVFGFMWSGGELCLKAALSRGCGAFLHTGLLLSPALRYR